MHATITNNIYYIKWQKTPQDHYDPYIADEWGNKPKDEIKSPLHATLSNPGDESTDWTPEWNTSNPLSLLVTNIW